MSDDVSSGSLEKQPKKATKHVTKHAAKPAKKITIKMHDEPPINDEEDVKKIEPADRGDLDSLQKAIEKTVGTVAVKKPAKKLKVTFHDEELDKPSDATDKPVDEPASKVDLVPEQASDLESETTSTATNEGAVAVEAEAITEADIAQPVEAEAVPEPESISDAAEAIPALDIAAGQQSTEPPEEVPTAPLVDEVIIEDQEPTPQPAIIAEPEPEPVKPVEPAPKPIPLPQLRSNVPVPPTQTPVAAETAIDSSPDAEFDKFIEDIDANDADKLISFEDREKAEAAAAATRKPSLGRRLRGLPKAWWRHRKIRNATILLLIAAIAALGVVPNTRYSILNLAGVRASSSLVVLDAKSQQPLRNVDVIMQGMTAKTDEDGKVSFASLKLGKTRLELKKTAFAPLEQPIILGWGSNPLGDFSLDPTGSRYSFDLTNWLTQQPISEGGAEVTYLDSTAKSDAKGRAELTINPPDEKEIEVTISGKHYVSQKVKVATTKKETTALELLNDDRHYYISKRSGKYDLYSAYLNGSDEQLILAGTGKERDDLTFSVNQDATFAALVSTRDGERNGDGYALSSLMLIDLTSKDYTTKKLASSEQIQQIGWYGSRLVYVRIAEGASATNPKRHRLISYDAAGSGELELAASNYFNDVLATKDYVYWAPSNSFQESPQPYLFRAKADGTNKLKVANKEIWNIFRTDYETLTLGYQQDWYSYGLADASFRKLDGQPTNPGSRLYTEGMNTDKALWVEDRDGKGTVIEYDKKTKKDTVLVARSGITNPVGYVRDEFIVFRVTSPSETADYVMSVNGGEPKKIKDVSSIASIDRWYYY